MLMTSQSDIDHVGRHVIQADDLWISRLDQPLDMRLQELLMLLHPV